MTAITSDAPVYGFVVFLGVSVFVVSQRFRPRG